MSQNQNEDSEKSKDILVDRVSDYIPTDVIVDLKTGIYNLFISLINNLSIHYGAVESVKQATSYLDTISDRFKKTLPENQEKQK